MARIHIGGAGGAPSNNFIRSMRAARTQHYLIGTSSNATDLLLADVDERHYMPQARDQGYRTALLSLTEKTRPDFIHLQNDFEVQAVSRLRESLAAAGIRYYLPDDSTIDTCVDKFKSYEIWKTAGVKVPRSMLIRNIADLDRAFSELGPEIWLRATEGGGGRGALPTDDPEFARIWIDRFEGWGTFTAAELLTKRTATWQSIWYNGELVVAQGRRRLSWNFGNRTLSGVTGVTGVGETMDDPVVDRIAQDSILSIDQKPHGIFCVDMTYDRDGVPNPTEINIGRFFTTHYFFTAAGINFPEIYCDIALKNQFPSLDKRVNPLQPGLIWIRGMDVEPVLTSREALEAEFPGIRFE